VPGSRRREGREDPDLKALKLSLANERSLAGQVRQGGAAPLKRRVPSGLSNYETLSNGRDVLSNVSQGGRQAGDSCIRPTPPFDHGVRTPSLPPESHTKFSIPSGLLKKEGKAFLLGPPLALCEEIARAASGFVDLP